MPYLRHMYDNEAPILFTSSSSFYRFRPYPAYVPIDHFKYANRFISMSTNISIMIYLSTSG